jgi:hypothetical protein
MSDPPPIADPIADQRADRELEHRLSALNEFAAILAARADIHSGLSLKHGGWWLGDWEAQKAKRYLAIAAILAAPEFAGFIRGPTSAVKRRVHSLFRQGYMLYDLLPTMRDDWLGPLMHRFSQLLEEQPLFADVFGPL